MNNQYSDEWNDMLSHTPHWILRRGIIVISLFILSLLLGSALFKYPSSITAPIIITSINPPADIKANTTGYIDTFFVENKATVHKGEHLALISNTASYRDVCYLSCLIDSITEAIIKKKPYHLMRYLKLGTLQNDYSVLILKLNSYNNYMDKQYYKMRISACEHLINMNSKHIKSLEKQKTLIDEQLTLEKKSLERTLLLNKKMLISDEEYEKAKTIVIQKEQNIEQAANNITNALSSKCNLEKELTELRNNDLMEYEKVTTELYAALSQAKVSLLDWVHSFLIIAPIEGCVDYSSFWASNQNIESGNVIMSIIPRKKTQIIGKISLPAEGSGKVKKKMKVNITLDRYPHNDYGFINGEITNIPTIPNKDNIYIVEVSLPLQLKTTYGRTIPIPQELTGQAEIITEDKSLLAYFLQPLKMIIDKHL